MSLTAQSPRPMLAWNFDNTTTDYITGLTGTVVGTTPGYVPGKYNQAISLINPAGTTPTSNVTWVLPFISTVGFTVTCWVNANTLPSSGTSQFVAITRTNPQADLRCFFNSGTTNATIACTYAFASGVYVGATTPTKYNTGTWNHVAATITESSTGSNVITVYVNGSFIGSSTSATSRPRSFNKFTIGSFCDGQFGSSFDGLIDDVRIYNTVLTAAQVQTVYAASGMPIRGVQLNTIGSSKTTMSGNPLFTRLSSGAVSSATGVFSLSAVNGTTAKAVNVKRQSDNVTQDFWVDRLGNLLTAPITGTPISTWLAGSTGNVVTWYDQSGKGNDVTQTVAANQPTLNLSNATISFNGSQWFNNASSTGFFIPLYQNSYSIVTKHRQWTVGAAWSTGNTASFTNFSFNGLRWATGNYYQNYRGGGFLQFGPQPGTFPVVATVVNDRINDIGYINGVQSATGTVLPNIEPVYAQFIGYDANSASNKFQGELHAVLSFGSALSTTDRNLIESLI